MDVMPSFDPCAALQRQLRGSEAPPESREQLAALWAATAQRLELLEERQKASTRFLESELLLCQERNRVAAAEKDALQQTVACLQARMAATEAQLCMAAPHPSALLRASTPQRPARTGTLGLPSPPRTPTREARLGASAALLKSPVPSPAFVLREDGGCSFVFTLRVADGVGLGVEFVEGGEALQILKVAAGGAIDAWNRQCVGGPSAGKAVGPGDRIVAVNGQSTRAAMLKECREKALLKFTVARGSEEEPTVPEFPVTAP